MINQPGRLFGGAYLLVFAVGLFTLLVIEKGDAVLYFAERRADWASISFRILTLWGDGIVVAVLIGSYLFIHYGQALTLSVIALLQLGTAALLKRVVFGNVPRPRRFFEVIEPEWLIEGVEHHSNYAFPSGHTLTAFSVSFFIALTTRSRLLALGVWLLAVLAGLSRVYLFQHFLQDVVAGSLVGMAVTWIGWKLATHPKGWMHQEWADQRLGKGLT